jgi:hypothetical protein
VFAPLILLAIFIPTLAVAALGNVRLRALGRWIVVAVVIVAALGAYDIFRDPLYYSVGVGTADPVLHGDVAGSSWPRNLPSGELWLAVAAGLFIAHALVVAGDADRVFLAKYPRLFDIAWKHAVQAALAGAFVGTLWVLLLLGTALFRVIGIAFFEELLRKAWFSVPVTTLAFALAIHVTDVQAHIVRGVRTVALTLLSWLMPLFALMATGFLASLLFTGLDPLWATRKATGLVVSAAAALAVLIDAAYQDGVREQPVALVLRGAGMLAAVALTPLVAIAAYAVMLRVHQYGWTPERVVVAACIVVAAGYAAGYGLAAVTGRPWLRRIETANVFMAMVVLAVTLALFSPLADPARLAVADQVRRLAAGSTPADRFDFAFLRFRGGRYGLEALARLRDVGEPKEVAATAALALNRAPGGTVATPASRADNITVSFPAGQTLPDSFVRQDWGTRPNLAQLPSCLTATGKCDAAVSPRSCCFRTIGRRPTGNPQPHGCFWAIS